MISRPTVVVGRFGQTEDKGPEVIYAQVAQMFSFRTPWYEYIATALWFAALWIWSEKWVFLVGVSLGAGLVYWLG